MLEGLYEVAAVVVSFIIGLIIARQYYKRFKAKLHELRELVDAVDDSLKDNRITRDEIQKIVDKAKDLLDDP